MNVTFYTFSKRINSTAQPATGTDYTVILKEPSSVISPRLDLIWTGTGSPTAFNYAYISDFGRYYWVQNWEYHDRKWTASLTVDVLASWKTEIGASAKYVLRSASDSDPDVFDNYYPATADETLDVVTTPTGWTPLWAAGSYILNAAGYQNTDNGLGVTLYQQTAAQAYDTIKRAYDKIYDLSDSTQASITDVQTALEWIGETTIRATTDLGRYINGYLWFPFLFQPAATTPSNVKLGILDAGEGTPVTSGTHLDTYDLSLPAWTALVPKWKACAPYTSYTLDLLPFGTIQLDSLALVTYGGCHIVVVTDAFTGIATLRVFAGTTVPYGPLLAIRTAQLGISVQYGAARVDLGRAAAQVISGVSRTVAGSMSGDFVTAGSGVLSAADALVPDVVTAGQTGNMSSIADTVRLYVRRLDCVGEDPSEHGKPLCQLRTISTLSGFILCRDGDISAPATDGELRQIESFLTGGFFYD